MQLLAAYRAYSARHRTSDRPGRPPEDMRDWFVGRARRIFRAAWSRSQQSVPDIPIRPNLGAIRPLDDVMQAEVEFIVFIAHRAGAALPGDVRALFSTPDGSIPAASTPIRPGESSSVPERQRVVDRIASKAARHRSSATQPPKIGPKSPLAAAIRQRLDAGASVNSIARELGCSPNTVKHHRQR